MVKYLEMGKLSGTIWVRIKEGDTMMEAEVLKQRDLKLLLWMAEDEVGVHELRHAGSL